MRKSKGNLTLSRQGRENYIKVVREKKRYNITLETTLTEKLRLSFRLSASFFRLYFIALQSIRDKEPKYCKIRSCIITQL